MKKLRLYCCYFLPFTQPNLPTGYLFGLNGLNATTLSKILSTPSLFDHWHNVELG